MQEDDDPEPVTPEDFLPANPYPPDARRMGIDRWSDDAAIIALAASLNPAKRSHKFAAWLMLFAIALPLLLSLWLEFRAG